MATTPETQPNEQPENDFAALIAPIRPYVDQYGAKVILGLAAVLIVAAGWIYFTKSAKAEKARGWDKLLKTNNSTAPEDFGDIAEDNPGTSAAEWAILRQAEGFLKRGVQSAFSNRKQSAASFEKAHKALNRLLNKTGTSVLVRERALYTMAMLTESESGADTADAIKAYEQLKSEFKDSVYTEQADARIEALKDPKVQQFYGWFRKQNPSIADPLGVPHDPIGTAPPTPGNPFAPGGPIIPGGTGDPEPPKTPEPGEPVTPEGTEPDGGTGEEKSSEQSGSDDEEGAGADGSTPAPSKGSSPPPTKPPKGDGSEGK